MFLNPVIAKAEVKAEKVLTQQANNVKGFLRRDGLNAVLKPQQAEKAAEPYFAPTTPILDPVAPKDCGNAIDFRF